jgi:hypothetical protein
MTYLNTLFRAHAEKAGAVYIDVWDGFVDESGRFAMQGPDFEGQIRRLRTPDGVFFTRSGARKLAHYVEREIRRVMAARAVPVAVTQPQEPAAQTSAKPGEAPPRPVAGPVVPLTTFAALGSDDQLLGGGPTRAATGDAAVARVLVKGEAVPPAKDRADDFVWPRPAVAAIDPIAAPNATPSPSRPTSAPAGKAGQAAPNRGGQSGKAEPAPPAPAQGKTKVPAKPSEHRTRQGRPQNAEAPARALGSEARGGPRPPMPIGPSAPSPRGQTLGGGF